jgi:hypothetical protein
VDAVLSDSVLSDSVLSPSVPPSSPVMDLLHDHLPITLLLDLALGVHSDEVYVAEPGDLSWLPREVA